MPGFNGDIEELAKQNTFFRKVLFTGPHSQLVLMSLAPGEDIGEEVHPDVDQILFCAEGKGESVLDGDTAPFIEDSVVFVPAGTKHNFVNRGGEPMKIYTVYSPPEHPDGTVHKTKKEAEASHHDS